MKRFVVTIIFCFLGFSALAQVDPPVNPVLQIADRKDEAGDWIWTELTAVTWDTTTPWTAQQVGDHNPLDDDINHDWFVPYNDVWWHVSFEREIAGLYAIRWKHSDSIWSQPETCTLRAPDQAKHRD